MKFLTRIVIFLSVLIKISIVFSNIQICKQILINPNNKVNCKEVFYSLNHTKLPSCVCRDMNLTLNLTHSNFEELINIKDKDKRFYVYFKNAKPRILDKSFNLLNKAYQFISVALRRAYSFTNMKGFDVDFSNISFKFFHGSQSFTFYDTSLAFYSNGRLLKTCNGFPKHPRSLFQVFKPFNRSMISKFLHDITIYDKKYQPICPLAFSNSIIDGLTLKLLTNTFYKTNLPIFLDVLPSNINSYIGNLYLFGYGGIPLTRRLLSPYVFNLTANFHFTTEIASFEKGLFKAFRNIKTISTLSRLWRKLFHKGIDWTYELNSDIKVDLNDSALIHKCFQNRLFVSIHFISEIDDEIYGTKPGKFFPDKDFCVYAKFPFEQMVVVGFFELNVNLLQMTCTLAWLMHSKQFLMELERYYRSAGFLNLKIDNETFNQYFYECDFYQR